MIRLARFHELQNIEGKFKRDWAEGKGLAPEVRAVYIIENEELKRKWIQYGRTLPLGYRESEEYYHGTKLLCDITNNEADLCTDHNCSVCRIAESGFNEQRIRTNIPNFQRFGHGFYLAPKSSKCHDYTQGAYTYRALVLCDVYPGKKYTLQKDDRSLIGPPPGYQSIYGQKGVNLNYEEILLPKADAILPKYIIVYRKDGEKKIAK